MDPQLIGSRVKMLMTVRNMKRKDLASQIGISYNTLTKKVNGQREFCIDEILKMKEIFELDLQMFSNVFFNPDFLVSTEEEENEEKEEKEETEENEEEKKEKAEII